MHPNSYSPRTYSDPSMQNDAWRVHHGYRELQLHRRPFRKNRDFKDIHYGDHLGMERYRRP